MFSMYSVTRMVTYELLAFPRPHLSLIFLLDAKHYAIEAVGGVMGTVSHGIWSNKRSYKISSPWRLRITYHVI